MCGVEWEVRVGVENEVEEGKGFPLALDLMEVGFVGFDDYG